VHNEQQTKNAAWHERDANDDTKAHRIITRFQKSVAAAWQAMQPVERSWSAAQLPLIHRR
jgi:hypothetical protein